jgi:hypothetical protein
MTLIKATNDCYRSEYKSAKTELYHDSDVYAFYPSLLHVIKNRQFKEKFALFLVLRNQARHASIQEF